MEYQKNKIYEITYGSYELLNDKRKKFEITESFNIETITVLAIDVYEALEKTGDYMLKQEKKWKKDNLGLFVESVKLISVVDIN